MPRACGIGQLQAAAAAAAGDGGKLVFLLDKLGLAESAQLPREVHGPQYSHLPDEKTEAKRLGELPYNPK